MFGLLSSCANNSTETYRCSRYASRYIRFNIYNIDLSFPTSLEPCQSPDRRYESKFRAIKFQHSFLSNAAGARQLHSTQHHCQSYAPSSNFRRLSSSSRLTVPLTSSPFLFQVLLTIPMNKYPLFFLLRTSCLSFSYLSLSYLSLSLISSDILLPMRSTK